MTAPGSAWDGGAADPSAAQFGYEPPTAPLPYGSAPADPPAGSYAGAPYGPGGGYRPPRPPRRRRRRLRRLAGALVVLFMLAAATFGVLLVITPSVGNAPALASAIDQAHHVAYPGPPVPALFAQSLVATEDHRFYSEPGIDVFAIARLVAGRITGQGDQGGATLYQQLAKMLYTPGQSGLRIQAEQVILGIKLDFSYPKAQILRMYADVAYFGHGYYGLAAASCGYFGTVPAGLTLPEAATLAGLVQAPSAYDPVEHYARARLREQHVLERLVATAKISQAQANAAFARQLHLVGGPGTGCTR